MREIKPSDLSFFQDIFAELRQTANEQFLDDRIDTLIEAAETLETLIRTELAMLRGFRDYLQGRTPGAGGVQ